MKAIKTFIVLLICSLLLVGCGELRVVTSPIYDDPMHVYYYPYTPYPHYRQLPPPPQNHGRYAPTRPMPHGQPADKPRGEGHPMGGNQPQRRTR